MKGDWIILGNDPCGTSAPAEPCDVDNADNVGVISLIDSSDVSQKQDALTIVRIVGDIPAVVRVTWAATGHETSKVIIRYRVYEGIYVSTIHPVTGTGETLLSPMLSDDMESGMWMWRHSRHGALITVGSGVLVDAFELVPGPHGNDAHVDIRVKRKLEQGQELVYVWTMTADARALDNPDVNIVVLGATDVVTTMQLRGYVKF